MVLLKKPKEDDIKFLKWERANAVVCSWILGSISESIYGGHAYSENAEDIWDDLCETYNKEDGSVIFNIHQRINSLTQSGSPVSEYYNKLDALWKEFDGLTNLVDCSCDAAVSLNNHSKLMKLMQFLSGLDDTYSQVKSHILLIDPLPTVKTAFSIVSREESHLRNCSFSSQSVNKNQTSVSAFNSKFNDQKKNKGRNPNYQNIQCKNCGIKGHTIDKCYKLIGFPKDFKPRSDFNNQNKSFSANSTSVSSSGSPSNNNSQPMDTGSHFLTSDQYNKFLSLINEKGTEEVSANANMAGTSLFNVCNNSVIDYQKWIVDSGANQHMTASESLLKDTVDVSKLNLLVKHPNGTSAKIQKIGNMHLSNNVTLFDVFVVPDFNVNLLSVHKLCKDSKCRVVFDEHSCNI